MELLEAGKLSVSCARKQRSLCGRWTVVIVRDGDAESCYERIDWQVVSVCEMSCVVPDLGATGVRELTCGSSATRQVVAVRERRKIHAFKSPNSKVRRRSFVDSCCILTVVRRTSPCREIVSCHCSNMRATDSGQRSCLEGLVLLDGVYPGTGVQYEPLPE